MSTLVDRIERANYMEGALGASGAPRHGTLFLFDDCCVWTHHQRHGEQVSQLAERQPEELVALDQHNWRVERANIAHAYFGEFGFSNTSVTVAPVIAASQTTSSEQAELKLKLADGAYRRLNFIRSGSDDHTQKDICQRWLGDTFVVGAEPLPRGLRGWLARKRRNAGGDYL